VGHHYENHTGIGANRKEAQADAVSMFYHENGHRCSIREVLDAKLIRRVPPNAWVTVGKDQHWKENPDAPASEWMEEWSFKLHYHS
jgi:hypothetical protein